CAISIGARRQFTETFTAPSFDAPNATSNQGKPFLSMNATRSPRFTPAAFSACATWLDRWSSSANVTDRPSTSRAGASGRSALCTRTISAMLVIVTSSPPLAVPPRCRSSYHVAVTTALERERTVATNGVELHVVEAGDGFPVVLAHGFPELAY